MRRPGAPLQGSATRRSVRWHARAAARALLGHSSLAAADIVRSALQIAGEIDIYTNSHIAVEEMECQS